MHPLLSHAAPQVGPRELEAIPQLFDGDVLGAHGTRSCDGAANAAALDPATLEALRVRFPCFAVVGGAVTHDQGSVVGIGCDDQFEFEFALDLLLDRIEALHERGWSSSGAGAVRNAVDR